YCLSVDKNAASALFSSQPAHYLFSSWLQSLIMEHITSLYRPVASESLFALGTSRYVAWVTFSWSVTARAGA
ncbi:MAG: hypothetical protein R3311_14000, partial [Oceanisphaera sp.]|nr:hypothetical protein [Oceanisphaera sp.]